VSSGLRARIGPAGLEETTRQCDDSGLGMEIRVPDHVERTMNIRGVSHVHVRQTVNAPDSEVTQTKYSNRIRASKDFGAAVCVVVYWIDPQGVADIIAARLDPKNG